MQSRLTRNTRAAYAAVSCCYAVIVISFVAAATAVVFALFVGLSHYFRFFGEIAVWIWAAGAVYSFFLDSARAKRSIESSRQLTPLDGCPAKRIATTVNECIHELTTKRRITKPKIYLNMGVSLESPASAAIHDAMFGYDVLMLSIMLVVMLPVAECRAVIAHELRHQNASTNKLKWVLRALIGVFARLWFCCTVSYIVLGLIAYTFGLKLAGRVWTLSELIVLPLLGLLLFGAVMLICRVLQAVMSRCDELKTDVLSGLDTEDGPALVHALKHLDAIAEMHHERMASVFRMLGFAPCEKTAKRVAWYWRWIFNVLWAYTWVTRSHPTTATRRRVLEWVYGPAGETRPLLPPMAAPIMVIEIVDHDEG